MKLLMVANLYPSKSFPYYGTFVKNFEEQLISNGISVDKSVMKKVNDSITNKLFNYISFYISTFIKTIFTSYNILYVHYISHSMLPIIACYYLKLIHGKLIINAHGSDIFPDKKQSEIFKKVATLSLNIADKIVVPSVYFKNEIIKTYNVPADKIFISPSGGINPNVFNDKKTRKFTEPFHFGFVSRIEKGKGWQVFLKAIKELDFDNIEVTIIGSGTELEELKNKILDYDLKDKVNLYPSLPQKELKKYFSKFHCFIFPSNRKGESLGLVGIEAMACGCIVIGSNNGGIPTYVEENNNGFLFDTDSIESLKEKIKKYLTLAETKKQEMSNNAKKTSENYFEQKVAEEMIAFLKHQVC